MKTKIVFQPFLYMLILCVLAISIASCTSIIGNVNDRHEASNLPSPFIWKTIINQATFYLVGSVHMGKKMYYPLPDQYMQCYEKADAIIMEIADDFDSLEEKVLAYAEKDRLSEDLYLRNQLDSETIKKILKVINKRDFMKYDQYSGWLLNMILEGNKLNLVGYDPESGIDMFFREKASDDKRQVIGLEKFEDQLGLYEFNLSLEMQVKIIEEMADSLEMQATAEALLIEAYFTGDADLFENIFVSRYDFEDSNIKRFYDHIFTERNRKWVEKLENISLKDLKAYMVIAGAGHFFGPENIRVLLERKGHEVVSLFKISQ